ncbi:sphingomyelin phosphodiesterase isoform X2 [Phycodurus eques]|uniref:sphingomyelin phosphodiesterase isoform X2 n=1 Tax=Phycodurus eques TaxID=693459 RepID=UPI002ACD4EEE|nr:sphingomyelin phosphodiesterase isoform X2 [Phycodurus eques]
MAQLPFPQPGFGLLTCALLFVLPLYAACHPMRISDQPQLVMERLSLPMVKFNWTSISCRVCQALFTILDVALLSDINEERVARAVGEACIRLHLADEQVCRDITELFRDDFIRALQESLLWPTEACAFLVGPSCGKFDIYASWNITLPKDPKPPVTPPVPPKPGSPQSRVLFLTDIHWDKEYITGSAADCKEPLCCRKDSYSPMWWRREAGYWGTYGKCDLPLRTVENLLENAAGAGPWDWVYWTGDIPAHNVWSQTRQQQLSALTVITRLIQKHLGPNVTVYPAIGNHESTPVNSFPPPFVHGNRSSAWLYNTMADEWSKWLPEQALKSLRYESTITGQFFGHTHFDEFQMFYDGETMTRPLGVSFIAPSVTTYINLNPGYRVYYVDGNYQGSSRMVLDHETFILNLTEANHKSGEPKENPKWTLLYRATETYGLASLFPSDLDKLVQGFFGDERLFQKFWYFRHKGHVSEPCKETCKTAILCFLRSGRYDLLQKCDLNGVKVRKSLC